MFPLRRLLPAVAAGVLLALIPIGGAALGATSAGANGDIAYVHGTNIQFVSGSPGAIVGVIDPSWSPDGKKLAFTTAVGHTIETCTVSACVPTPVGAPVVGRSPVWSPDGGKLAYVSDADSQIHTVKVSDTTSDVAVVAGSDPTWSPDGTQIAYTSAGQVVKCTVSSCASTAATVAASGSNPAWSPDGNSIAFQAVSGGHTHIFVVPAGGGSETTVTSGSNDQTAPSWSPDSGSIVYADSVDGIDSSTQGVGGAWGSPQHQDTTVAGDTSPDWQTVAPIAVSPPTINGALSPQTGQLLSTTNGTWQGASATGFTYQWRRCDSGGNNCSDIGGATSSTYAVVQADVGNTLRVVVTASNAAGSTPSSPSSPTGVVTQAGAVNPPKNTAYPTISLPFGQTTSAPLLGTTVTATTGTWTGSFPITFTYQWKQCDADDPVNGSCFNIVGATSSFLFVPTSAYGKRLRVQVTASNSAGAVSQNSIATDVVTANAPVLRSTPQIVGALTPVVDQTTLSLSAGTWDGSTPITFTYSWRRCDAQGTPASCIQIPGATTATYVPTVADIGSALRVWITGTNPAGSAVAITNHTFPVVDKQHFAPAATTSPGIDGVAQIGLPLIATAGIFSGDAPIATTVAWWRCDATGADCHLIAHVKKLKYTPTIADVGFTLVFSVTAKNAYGTLTVKSDPTEPVPAPPPHRRGRHIVGTSHSDYLVGTRGDDVIVGGAGSDTIIGNGGYDRIAGGSGNDVITVSGPGGSHVDGGPGSDTIYAANGFKDVITCGPGNDRVVVDSYDVVDKSCEVVVVKGGAASTPIPTPTPTPTKP